MGEPTSKLSPQARKLLAGEDPSEDRGSVDVLIRVRNPAAKQWREKLESAGASVRTVAGDVCTAAVPVSALQPLAELPDVVSIELTSPLYPESPPTE